MGLNRLLLVVPWKYCVPVGLLRHLVFPCENNFLMLPSVIMLLLTCFHMENSLEILVGQYIVHLRWQHLFLYQEAMATGIVREAMVMSYSWQIEERYATHSWLHYVFIYSTPSCFYSLVGRRGVVLRTIITGLPFLLYKKIGISSSLKMNCLKYVNFYLFYFIFSNGSLKM